MAEEKGLYIGLLPTWGDKVDKDQWGAGPVVFNADNAAVYGKFLGKRYADFPNIIWINGGDRKGGGDNFTIWDTLGQTIKSEDKNHLMTYHPSGEASSSQWFHTCDWLDFNICQTSHVQTDYGIYRRLLVRDYELFPVKPCMDAEPRYEDIPVAFKEDDEKDMAVATRGNGYALIYLPNGNEVEVSLEKIEGAGELELHWFDPRTGDETPLKKVKAEGTLTITPPTCGKGNDWILIMKQL
jgi:hypothetical protein